jgi:hypothetical protein
MGHAVLLPWYYYTDHLVSRYTEIQLQKLMKKNDPNLILKNPCGLTGYNYEATDPVKIFKYFVMQQTLNNNSSICTVSMLQEDINTHYYNEQLMQP